MNIPTNINKETDTFLSLILPLWTFLPSWWSIKEVKKARINEKECKFL